MNSKEATNQLHRELREYMSLTSEEQKQAFWNRIKQEADSRTEEEKSLIKQAITADVAQIRERILNLKERVDEATSVVES